MKLKNKLLTVLTVFLLLIVIVGLGLFNPGREKNRTKVAEKNSGSQNIKSLGGIKSRMPDNSAAVFFGSTIGQQLSKYCSYKNIDEMLFALRSGEVDTLWACDVTADYLVSVNTDLKIFEPVTESDIQKTDAERFEFGMALKDTEASWKLKEDIDGILSEMLEDGTLEKLTYAYIENAPAQDELPESSRLYPSGMRSVNAKDTLYVGVSGAVSPIEMLDKDDKPYGFCVALMDEIGLRTGKRIKFVVLDNETAFTSLMSGRVDMLFCYGTGIKTTENKASYIMTDGYFKMQKYKFIKLK